MQGKKKTHISECPLNGGSYTKNIILQLEKIHNNFYDYSNVILIEKMSNKINIICPFHGNFSQTVKSHKIGAGCNLCAIDKNSKNKIFNAKNKFIDKSNIIHNNFYNYDNIVYKNAKDLVVISCPIHGNFELSPNKHLNGRGCQKCGIESRTQKRTKNVTNFIEEANKIHNNKYDYSNIVYVNTDKKVDIICPYHGIFKQSPSKHLNYNGCNSCNKTGFNHSRQSYFYIHSISKNNVIISYKFGITNTHPSARLVRQNYYSIYKISDFYSVNLKGSDAYNLEKIIKNSIPTSFIDKSEMKDGYTETINPNEIDILENLIIEYLTK